MLTDAKARQAKPAAKGYKLPDSGGLHLFVAPTGVKSWRWRYERGGRERLVTLGQYPAMGLAQARARRESLTAEVDATDSDSRIPLAQVAEQWLCTQAPRRVVIAPSGRGARRTPPSVWSE